MGQLRTKLKPRELKGIVMLVLTRKRSEMIQIGDDIRIKVIRTASGHVKLGIDAPGHVRVLRAELVGTPPTTKTVRELEFDDRDLCETASCLSDQYPHPHIV